MCNVPVAEWRVSLAIVFLIRSNDLLGKEAVNVRRLRAPELGGNVGMRRMELSFMRWRGCHQVSTMAGAAGIASTVSCQSCATMTSAG